MKNKRNIILLSASLMVLLVMFIVVVWTLLKDGNSSIKPDEMDIVALYKVNIYGTQGEGYVDYELDEGYFEAYIIESGIELSSEDISLDVSKLNNLSNGDKFTISFKNHATLEEKGVKIARATCEYTVANLKEGTDFDVFSDLSVYVNHGQVVFDDSECSNFIKDNVDFFIKTQQDTYKEGDAILVGAYIDMNAATDNGYRIDKTEMTIIIKEQEKTND